MHEDLKTAVQTAQTALGALDSVVNLATQPFNAANHLSEALKSLHHASEAAMFCENICKDMIATACSRAPILCDLLTLGNLYPEEHQQLNRSLHVSLKLALEAVESASHAIYGYMRGNTMTRLMYAHSTRHKIEEQRTYLKSRFDDIQAHVQYATYLQGWQAQERRSRATVRPVEDLRRDLESLQHIERADTETVRAIANAVAERKKSNGQKIDVLESVSCVAVSPDGKCFSAVGQGKSVNAVIYGTAAGARVKPLKGHTSFVKGVAWNPDGSRLATCSHDKTAAIWDAATGERTSVLEGHSWWVNAVAWSSDGCKLATASHDKRCVLWNIESGEQESVLEGHSNWVHSVCWTVDGRNVVTGSEDQTAVLWDVKSGERIRVFSGHTEWVKHVSLSPDSSMFATASGDDTACIWMVATGECMHVLQGHTNWVNTVAWSPDGRVVATGSDDDRVALWNVSTGARMHVLVGHTGLVNGVAWSPCGKYVYSASQDGTVRIYCVRACM